MTADSLVQLAQFSTILVGSLGIAVALISHRRQLNAQMFIEFSARFQSVIRAMPSHVWITSSDLTAALPPPREELTKCSLAAFHVLADLYHLHRGGYISHDLWGSWHLGIKRTLQNPLLRREWNAIEGAFNHYPEYCRYVRGLTGNESNGSRFNKRKRGRIACQDFFSTLW